MDIHLEGVQKTLLLPLYGRAKLSKENNPLLSDNRAVEIVDKLNYDFNEINKNTPYVAHIYALLRAKIIDDSIVKHLRRHPKATIINLGAGLDTTFYRVDNNLISWYDIDLPQVIELRNRLIPETSRSKCIKASIFDMDWVNSIEPADCILFICMGVFEYFDKRQVIEFLIQLSEKFPDSEIIFNTTSNNALNTILLQHNMKLMAMEVSPTSLGNIFKSLKRLKEKMVIVEHYSILSRISLKGIFSKKILRLLRIFCLIMQAKIIHIRFSSTA